ncbi:MFS transporter [Secundilactobacillus oryzae]|nr:MFS transporter [Secundilactobacillus oryzae]
MPHFLSWTLVTGLIYGALFSYISASAFIFEKTFHLSPQVFSLFYALNGLGMILGNNIPGRLINRYSERFQVKIALIITILASGALWLSSLCNAGLWVVVALILVFVIMNGVLLTLSTAIIMNLSDKNAGSASAMVGLSQNAFGSVASPLVGALGTGYAPMAGIIFITNLMALGLMGRKKA